MVFITKKQDAEDAPSFCLGVALNKARTKGFVGLEIEIEGKNLPRELDMPGGWVYHQDGSLRGDENGEYVLKNPIAFNQVGPMLDKLWSVFSSMGSRLDESNRTSVHVHLNCQEFFLDRLAVFASLYFIFEEILTNWCGEHRVGNLFCLRAKDAPGIVTQLKRFIVSNAKSEIRDGLHYSGFNIHALSKFGSIEIRTLRGVSDRAVIVDWIAILERLYNLSAEYSDPRTVCTEMSGTGPLAFFDSVFGPLGQHILTTCGMTTDEVRNSIYDGMRMAQDLCYCRDWSDFKPVKVAPDPFGRSPKSILAGLSAASDGVNPASPSVYEIYNQISNAQQANTLQSFAPHWSAPPPIPTPTLMPITTITHGDIDLEIETWAGEAG